MTIISIIVAVSDNGVIGREGKLPWHLPADLKRFKSITIGKPIIMGRKTYESIGRPLPERYNIVVSRDSAFRPTGVIVCHDLGNALAEAKKLAGPNGEIMIIGGRQIYENAMPVAQRIYLTRVHGNFEGDVLFPIIDSSQWCEVSCEPHKASAGDVADYSFIKLERITPNVAPVDRASPDRPQVR